MYEVITKPAGCDGNDDGNKTITMAMNDDSNDDETITMTIKRMAAGPTQDSNSIIIEHKTLSNELHSYGLQVSGSKNTGLVYFQ